jgi:hypothetical protein
MTRTASVPTALMNGDVCVPTNMRMRSPRPAPWGTQNLTSVSVCTQPIVVEHSWLWLPPEPVVDASYEIPLSASYSHTRSEPGTRPLPKFTCSRRSVLCAVLARARTHPGDRDQDGAQAGAWQGRAARGQLERRVSAPRPHFGATAAAAALTATRFW